MPWGVVLGSPDGSFLHRLATALEIRGTLHWGGWSDGVIDAWHQVFAYNDFARPAFPSNEIHLALHPPFRSTPVQIDQATFAFGDVVLRNQLLLWQGGDPLRDGPDARAGVSLRLDLKIPTGSLPRMGGSGGWDVGLGLLGTWQATSWLVGHAIVSGSLLVAHARGSAAAAARLAGQRRALARGPAGRLVDRPGGPLVRAPPFQYGWGFVEVNPEWNLQSSATTAVTLSAEPDHRRGALGAAHLLVPGGLHRRDTCPGLGPSWFYDSNAPDVAMGLTLTLQP